MHTKSKNTKADQYQNALSATKADFFVFNRTKDYSKIALDRRLMTTMATANPFPKAAYLLSTLFELFDPQI